MSDVCVCVWCCVQVRMLLKELEQARGSLVTHRDDQSGGDDDGDVSDAQSVISQKLVTFRSVSQLLWLLRLKSDS